MKRWLPLFIAVAGLAAVLPQTTFAQSNTLGQALQWNNCWGATGATTGKNFACNTNTGVDILNLSFVPPGGMTELVGASGVVDVHTDQAALPGWWDITPVAGGTNCRPASSISSNFNFSAGPNFDCADPWSGQASGGSTAIYFQFNDPTRVRINWLCAVALTAAIIPDSTLQYYVCNLAVGRAKTTGAGACTGCNFGACIRSNSMLLSQTTAGGGDVQTYGTSPAAFMAGSVQEVVWNTDPVAPSCTFTPTRKETWGSIKSLYR